MPASACCPEADARPKQVAAQGARLGDAVLAANAVLITFLLLLSNLLDGFANAAEALVGEAHGSRSGSRWSECRL